MGLTAPAAPERLLVSVNEAAVMLGIGDTLAGEMVRAGAIPTLRIGRRRLVPVGRLREMIAGRMEAEEGDATNLGGSEAPRRAIGGNSRP